MWQIHSVVQVRPLITVLTALLTIAAVSCAGSDTVGSEATATPTVEIEITSFYLEADISLDQNDSESVFPGDGLLRSELRWRFGAPGRFRREFEAYAPPSSSGGSFVVSNGDSWVSFDEKLNRYTSSPALQFPQGIVPVPPTSIVVGPLQATDMDTWLARIRQGSSGFDAQIVGTDQMLGRIVTVYQFSDVGAALDIEGASVSGLAGRMWYSSETNMVLRYEGQSSNGITAEVTHLELNEEIDPSKFEFDPPATAVEFTETGGSHVITSGVDHTGRPRPQEGLLDITRAPLGLVHRSGSTNRSMGIISFSENLWSQSGDLGTPAVRVRQFVNHSGFPDAYVSGETVDSNTKPGARYHVTRFNDKNVIRLAWQDDGVTVEVDGVGVQISELIAVSDGITRPSRTAP